VTLQSGTSQFWQATVEVMKSVEGDAFTIDFSALTGLS
jgi:hypothetical protein